MSSLPETEVARFDRWLPFDDKVQHFVGYAVLGLLLARGRARSHAAVAHLALILLGSAFGGLLEWYQTLIDGRSAELADGLANVLGVCVGYGLAITDRVTRWLETT